MTRQSGIQKAKAQAGGLGLVLTGLLLLAAALAPAAQAVPKYVHRVVAEGPGTEAGQIHGQDAEIAVNYSSVADGSVDPMGNPVSGYVYVVEGGSQGNHRVQVFSAAGEFQYMWGQGVLNGTPAPQLCRRTDSSCAGGQIGTQGGSFNSPEGIAINQNTGHVFIRERGNLRVQEFTAAGGFVRAWGWDVVQDGGTGDTPADEFETCFVATQCKSGVSGSGPGQFGIFSFGAGIGIDVLHPSGELFVADPPAQRIQRFNVPAAVNSPVVPVGFMGSAAIFAGTRQPGYMAIDDTAGVLYASDGENFGAEIGNEIERYDLEGDIAPGGLPGFLSPISISTVTGVATDAERSTRGLEVDPHSGNLFIARDRGFGGSSVNYVFEFGNAAAQNPAAVTKLDTHVDGTRMRWRGTGLDPDSGDIYGIGSHEGSNKQFLVAANDGPLPPAAAGNFVYDPEAKAAKIDFDIDTNGLIDVEYVVRMANAATPSNMVTVASGTVDGSPGPVPVTVQVSGLRPATAYVVKVSTAKAFNNPSSESSGPLLQTDKLAPQIDGVHADSLTQGSARLTARINPHGIGLSYHFEWGEGNFATSVPVPDATLGGSHGFEFVAEQIAGLAPATTYQFRLVATSSDSGLPVTTSPVETFTTLAAPPSAGRAFELVSATDKYGGQGLGFWPWALGHIAASGTAAHSGERFMLVGSYGTSISKDGAYGLNTDQMFSERISDQHGWQGQPVLSHPEYNPVVGKTIEAGSTAEDFSATFWRSPSSVAFFPEMTIPNPDPEQPNWVPASPGWLSNWNGTSGGPTRWELFGPRGLGPDEVVKSADLFGATMWQVAVSPDGSTAYGMTGLTDDGSPVVYGLAGPEDPTSLVYGSPSGDLVAGRSIYYTDLTEGLSDTLAGVGARKFVNVCSGSAGSGRTAIPTVTAGVVDALECPPAQPGRERLISDHGAAYAPGDTTPRKIVSRDGSRLFFLSPDPDAPGVPSSGCTGSGASTLCPPQLYVQQRNADGTVVVRWISKAEGPLFGEQSASLAAGVRFEGASRDGGVVYFRTNAPLTVDDPNGSGAPAPVGGVKTGTPQAQSWDLYRFELADGADPAGPGSSLTRVSAGPAGNGDCNSPLSGSSNAIQALRFASDDGRRAYFTCAAPLPSVPAPANGTVTTPGGAPTTTNQTNLYLYDAGLPQPQRWRFVARLPREASNGLDTCASTGVREASGFNGGIGYHPNIAFQGGVNCVRGSADGSFITWFTTGRLTADVPGGTPVDEASAKPVADIYGYDATADELTRITAPQDGEETPYACVEDDPAGNSGVDESLQYSCRGDMGVDAQVGGGGLWHLGVAVEPLTAGDRIAFFNSASRLVPEDEDGGYDVYEWRNGRLSLVTSGSPDSKDALYKGNDRTGRDLYFVTREALTWQDTDAVADVYTARVDGGIDEPPPPVVCEVLGGACKPPSPPAPPPSPAASTVLEGAGNVVEEPARPRKCPKGKARKGKRCVKKAKSKGQKGKSQRHQRAASQTGRAGR